MLHLASVTPGGSSRPLPGDLQGWVETTELVSGEFDAPLGENMTPEDRSRAGGHRVVYVHVASGQRSYQRPPTNVSTCGSPAVLQSLDGNSPRASASRKKQSRSSKKRLSKARRMMVVSPPAISPGGISEKTSSPAPSSTMSTPPSLDLSMVFSSTEPTTPHRTASQSPSSSVSKSDCRKTKSSSSSSSLLSTARVVQRLRSENKILIVRDTQNRQIISDLQERLDNAHHASSSLATKNARGDNLRELEDELHIVRKSASEFRERIQAVNLELSSQQRLVAEMRQVQKTERQRAREDEQATRKQLLLVVESCEAKEAEHASAMSILRQKYEKSAAENVRLSMKCDSMTAENKDIESRRAATAERLAEALASLHKHEIENRKSDDIDGDHNDREATMRARVAAAVQIAREQWQERALAMAKKDRLLAEERLERAIRRTRSEADVALSKVKQEAQATLEKQRLKHRAMLVEAEANAAASSVELVTSVRVACERDVAVEREKSAQAVPRALRGIQKRFQEELTKKKDMYEKHLGEIDATHRMELYRQTQMSAVRICSMYFRQQRAKKKALALWQWKNLVSEARLGEVVGMTLEHTKRTGAAYCFWGIMQKAAFRKVVVAFRHWETLTFEELEEESETEVSFDNIRASRLRPWMFESALHTSGVWRGFDRHQNR